MTPVQIHLTGCTHSAGRKMPVGAGPRCLPCSFTANAGVGQQGTQRGPAPTLCFDSMVTEEQLARSARGTMETTHMKGNPAMRRPVTLFTGQFADLPLEELARKVSEWGFDGLELACWGDHFEIDRVLSEDSYVRSRRDILDRYNLKCFAISNHLVGQAVCDFSIDERHKGIVPARIWGDGEPEGVRRRAAENMKNAARAAALFGVPVVNGFTGSMIWHTLAMFPPVPAEMLAAG